MPNWTNPQSWNHYSYCLNNPLRYIDPTGHAEGDWWDPRTYISKAEEVVDKATDWAIGLVEEEIIDPVNDLVFNALLDLEKGLDLLDKADATVGIGLNFQIGCGLGISFTPTLVIDGSGKVGFQLSGGGGGYAGVGGSVMPLVQITSADSIRELGGISTQTGVSIGQWVCGGMEYVVGETYQGFNFMAGWGGGLPLPISIEMHSIMEYGGLVCVERVMNPAI